MYFQLKVTDRSEPAALSWGGVSVAACSGLPPSRKGVRLSIGFSLQYDEKKTMESLKRVNLLLLRNKEFLDNKYDQPLGHRMLGSSKLIDLNLQILEQSNDRFFWVYDLFDGQIYDNRTRQTTDLTHHDPECLLTSSDVIGVEFSLNSTQKWLQFYKNGKKMASKFDFDPDSSFLIENGILHPFIQAYQCEVAVFQPDHSNEEAVDLEAFGTVDETQSLAQSMSSVLSVHPKLLPMNMNKIKLR